MKKLKLNTETLRNLSNEHLFYVQAGMQPIETQGTCGQTDWCNVYASATCNVSFDLCNGVSRVVDSVCKC
jgi:hypothetical protein